MIVLDQIREWLAPNGLCHYSQGSPLAEGVKNVFRTQNGPHLWKGISYYMALVHPCIYPTITMIRNLQHNFPEIWGGQHLNV